MERRKGGRRCLSRESAREKLRIRENNAYILNTEQDTEKHTNENPSNQPFNKK